VSAELHPIQVVRGMPVDAMPVRLHHAAKPQAQAEAAPRPEALAHERELQRAREQVLREAREEGFRSGREEGLHDGRKDAEAQLRAAVEQAMADALHRIEAARARLRELADALEIAVSGALESAQDELAALCFETLCRVFGAHAVQPATVRAQVAHLLALHGGRERLVLHVHPQDAELLAQSVPALRCQPDPEVTLGGCVLRSPAGSLDARLEQMLAACRDALLQARSRDLRVPVSPGDAS
jgi:flagellar assembly protein FliH